MFGPAVGVDAAFTVMQPVLNHVSVVDIYMFSDAAPPAQEEQQGIAGLFNFFGKILQYFLAFVIGAGVLGLMVVGLMYITSKGDSRQMGQAKTFAFAIAIGLTLSVAAFFLVGTLVSEVDSSIGGAQKVDVSGKNIIEDESYKELLKNLGKDDG